MLRQIISSLTLIAFLLYTMGITGCTRLIRIPIERVPAGKAERSVYPIGGSIKSLRKQDGTHVSFDKRHGRIDTATNAVVGHSPENEYVSVPINEVAILEVSTTDNGRTALTVLGVVAGIGLFIYSVAQMEYDFDFEWESN